jgi:gamma-glutamylcyclotransferase (GGCT)/AIG2-like uncharacterized protein YtfP
MSAKEPARAISRAMVMAGKCREAAIITAASTSRERVFVYGTLKRGFRNHHLMAEALFVGDFVAHGLRLYDLGPFPMAVAEACFQVQGEVYGVTSQHLEALDRFEGVPRLYQRAKWQLSDGQDAWVYVGRHRQVRSVRPIGPHYRKGVQGEGG